MPGTHYFDIYSTDIPVRWAVTSYQKGKLVTERAAACNTTTKCTNVCNSKK
jgi:hypothetical protein